MTAGKTSDTLIFVALTGGTTKIADGMPQHDQREQNYG